MADLELGAWLAGLGCSHLLDNFQDQQFESVKDVLDAKLDADDLDELGVDENLRGPMLADFGRRDGQPQASLIDSVVHDSNTSPVVGPAPPPDNKEAKGAGAAGGENSAAGPAPPPDNKEAKGVEAAGGENSAAGPAMSYQPAKEPVVEGTMGATAAGVGAAVESVAICGSLVPAAAPTGAVDGASLPPVDSVVDVLFNLGPRRGRVRSHSADGKFRVHFQEGEGLWLIDPSEDEYRAAPGSENSVDAESQDVHGENGANDELLPTVEDDIPELEVTRLVKKRQNGGTTEYLVKWAAYTDMTWMSSKNCELCPGLIGSFERRQRRRKKRRKKQSQRESAPSPISANSTGMDLAALGNDGESDDEAESFPSASTTTRHTPVEPAPKKRKKIASRPPKVKVEEEPQEPKSLREAVVRHAALFNGDRVLLTRHIARKVAASPRDFEVATRLIEQEVSAVCQFDPARKCWLIREPFDELLPPVRALRGV
jgi:hypothetical protein